VGPAVAPHAGDLAGLEPGQPRPLAAAPGGARRPALLELGGALAQARAAVRALRDVRGHLGVALLADDEELRSACHPSDSTRPRRAAEAVRSLWHGGARDLAHDLVEV